MAKYSLVYSKSFKKSLKKLNPNDLKKTKEVLENIKSLLLSIDPNTKISYKNHKDDYYISDEDAKKLDKACEEIENGQAQYLSFDEVKKLSSENLRKLGADI